MQFLTSFFVVTKFDAQYILHGFKSMSLDYIVDAMMFFLMQHVWFYWVIYQVNELL